MSFGESSKTKCSGKIKCRFVVILNGLNVCVFEKWLLQDLSTRGVWLQSKSKEGYRDAFYEALRCMPKLRNVTIPYVADDQLLRILAANSQQLTILDLSGAMELTDDGVRKW